MKSGPLLNKLSTQWHGLLIIKGSWLVDSCNGRNIANKEHFPLTWFVHIIVAAASMFPMIYVGCLFPLLSLTLTLSLSLSLSNLTLLPVCGLDCAGGKPVCQQSCERYVTNALFFLVITRWRYSSWLEFARFSNRSWSNRAILLCHDLVRVPNLFFGSLQLRNLTSQHLV